MNVQCEYETIIKLLLIGNSGVGKTNFIFRYVENSYTTAHLSTVGFDFKSKLTKLPKSKKTVKLQIWDTAGQERYISVNKSLFLKVQGILLFYSVTDRESFDNIKNWIDIIKDTCDLLPIILIGNKIDDENNRVVREEEGKNLAKKYNLEFMECSGKKNIKVKEAFDKIGDIVIQNNIGNKNNNIKLGVIQESKSTCC